MSYLPPPIEVLPNQPAPPEHPDKPRRAHRLVGFLTVFLPALVLGLGYVWLREPLYQSRATLLTVAPIVIDQPGVGGGDHQVIIQNDRGESAQHVTIQQQTLLGPELLESVLARLHAADAARGLSTAELQAMLAVTPFPDTNVVELRAQGSDDALLPAVINAWIDAYQTLRARESSETEDNTAAALREEVTQLENKVENKRQALDLFRRTHDILTREDADSQAIARLRGLNESLNKAGEEEVKAKARIDAAREAIARGETIAPPEERASLSFLEQRAQSLREKLAELRRRYTNSYITLQPQLKVIPEQLRQTEKEIALKAVQGQKDEIAAAERAYQAARQATLSIRAQIEAHKREVAEFTTRFSQHEAMTKELADMEELYRKTQDQLLHLEVAPKDKLPQLSVVSRASPPGAPIWPDYRRDSGIALGCSLALALFAVWLYEFLTKRPHASMQPAMHIPNIQVYSVPENIMLARQAAQPASLIENRTVALEQAPPRELSETELRVLMEHASIKAHQLIAVLLSGLSLDEATNLQEEDFDLENQRIRTGGTPSRSVALPPALQTLFADHRPLPAWGKCDAEELASLVACAAVDSGLSGPDKVGADALRHTYIAYLVRQGIRLSELEQVVGPLPAKTLAWYGRLSPPGPGLRLDAVQLIHPALRVDDTRETA